MYVIVYGIIAYAQCRIITALFVIRPHFRVFCIWLRFAYGVMLFTAGIAGFNLMYAVDFNHQLSQLSQILKAGFAVGYTPHP